MANPNPDVWGVSDTWQFCKYKTCVGNGNSNIKAMRPQIANFGNNDGSLYAGNLNNKTPIDTMIDLTICPCGQDSAVSVFGKIGMFYNYQNVEYNVIPNRVIESTEPINWFFYDGYYNWTDVIRDHRRDRQSAADRWSPEMTMTNNMNGAINPFVYYQIRSILAFVVVACITGYNASGVPQITWRMANDWKTNYSSQKIADVRLQLYSYSSNTDTTITYFEVIDSGNNTIHGVSLLLSTSDEYSEDVIDYAIINSGKYSMPSLIGMNLAGNWYEGRCFYMCGYDMFDGQTYGSVVRSGVTDGGWCVWTEIPYNADNYEKIMKMTACFGVMFTDKAKFTFPLDCVDDDLYLPVLDNKGIAHGEYTHGANNVNNPFYELDSIRDVNYNPYGGDGAFYEAENLEYVKIPKSVTSIGDHAFAGTKLKEVCLSRNCTFKRSTFPSDCKITFYEDMYDINYNISVGGVNSYRTTEYVTHDEESWDSEIP